MPWNAVTPRGPDEPLVVAMTKAQLEAAPEFATLADQRAQRQAALSPPPARPRPRAQAASNRASAAEAFSPAAHHAASAAGPVSGGGPAPYPELWCRTAVREL